MKAQPDLRRALRGGEREKWEQKIQKEAERMREERENGVLKSKRLTEEQRKIRRVIRQRTYCNLKKKATDEKHRQERVAQIQSGEETETIIQGRQNQVLSEEEQQLQAPREQAEEKLIGGQRKQHFPWTKKLTDQEEKDYQRMGSNYRCQLRIEREATDEKYRRLGMAGNEERQIRAEREQAEEKLIREQRKQDILRSKTLTDQQRKDRMRIRSRNCHRQIRVEMKAADEKDRRWSMAQEEERRSRAERAQAEEKLIREEREQHIHPRSKKLTDQQRKDRHRICARNYNRRIRMGREATDEKYRQKKMAQRNSAGEGTINAEIDNPVVEAPPTVDHPMS